MQNFMILGAAALGIALLGASPVMAQESGEASEVSVAQENPNERICRRVHVTGSNIPQRVCMSRAEWADLRAESQETMRDTRGDRDVNLETENGY